MLQEILNSNVCRRRLRGLWTPGSRTLATTTTSTPDTTHSQKNLRPPLITAIILNRAPIITRTPTPFERAYYDYQARIQRALHNPFPYEFYFKQGSVLESRFNIEERKRERGAFGRPFSLRSVAGGEEIATTLQDLGPVEGDGEIIMPRKHDADGTNDVKSLDRRGQRNLYLLLMDKEGGRETWRFPRGDVGRSELLHQAAYRNLLDECGSYMDTWVVSRNPIGVYRSPSPDNIINDTLPLAPVTFFFKAHIMAGQVRPDEKLISDFAWLTKQEISSRVDEGYWLGVKDMLSDF